MCLHKQQKVVVVEGKGNEKLFNGVNFAIRKMEVLHTYLLYNIALTVKNIVLYTKLLRG